MKTKPKDKMKMLVARVPEEVHKAIKVRSAEEGKSIAVVVEGLIRAYLVKGDLLDRRKSWGLDAEEVGAGVKEMTRGTPMNDRLKERMDNAQEAEADPDRHHMEEAILATLAKAGPGDPFADAYSCLLYTSPSPRDRTRSRMPSSA